MVNNLTPETYATAVADLIMNNMGGHRISDAKYEPLPLTQFVDVSVNDATNEFRFITAINTTERPTEICFKVNFAIPNIQDTSYMTSDEFMYAVRNAIRTDIYNCVFVAMKECWDDVKDITTITPELIKAHPVLMFVIQIAPYPLKFGKYVRNRYVEYSEKHLKRVIPIELVCADGCTKACSDLSITIKFNKKTGHRECSCKSLMKST